MKDLKTAVVIFAYTAEYEAMVKPFLHSKAVFESLNQRVLQIVKDTQLPYFLITEKEQVGTTFGARFTHALQTVYDLGYESLIVVGNDTPHLSTSQIKVAATLVAENKLVVGESHDGGFYLLGIQKKHFQVAPLQQLPWHQQNLGAALSNLFGAQAVPVSFLKKLHDIDGFQDIKKVVLLFKKVYRFLFELFLIITFQKKTYTTSCLAVVNKLLLSDSYNKGSPCFI